MSQKKFQERIPEGDRKNEKSEGAGGGGL